MLPNYFDEMAVSKYFLHTNYKWNLYKWSSKYKPNHRTAQLGCIVHVGAYSKDGGEGCQSCSLTSKE